ncbi:MAG: TonB-dependent receptor [Bacteroidales bacterium]|nr:TonB-dependent receptor [Bacteroidales bacterium]
MTRLHFIAALLCAAMCYCHIHAATITGHTVSKADGSHIPYLTVILTGTTYGTNSDETGHFRLDNVKSGRYTMEVSGIGFVTQRKTIDVKGTVNVNFEMIEDMMMLEQVVVTGNKSEVKRRNSSTLVSVLSNKVFDMVGASCLADGLSYQPGVRVENDCQNCGFTQVRINGLDGHYSQILMDSRPVYSALTGVYGLEQIPANMIDRVEVIRGGGSALFGSSAIGGTVNIITKDPIINSAEVAHTLTSQGVSGALDNNTTFNASLVSDNHRAGMMVYGQNRNRAGYDHDGDHFTEVPMLRSQTLGFRSYIRTSDLSKLTLQYHGVKEFRRGGDNLYNPPHEAEIAEQTDHRIHGGGINFDLYSLDENKHFNVFSSFQLTNRDSYYGGGMDLNAYGWTKDFVVVSGAQYTHRWKRLWFLPAELVGGVEHKYNYLRDVSVGYDHDALQRVHNYSAYLQNEWRNDTWGFLIGGRLDKHSMVSHPIFSPRANVRYNPSKQANLRLTYSSGFRAPQAFDEDFHIAVVGGERVVTVLASDLREERSNSVSLSGDFYHNFGPVQSNLLVEAFFTDLSDVFALRQLDEPDAMGNKVLERYNGSGARVMGANIETRFVFSHDMQLQAGFTWQRSRYKQPEQWSDNPGVPAVKRMFRTPDTYGYITYKYNPIHPLGIALTGTFTGPMLVQHLAGSGTETDVAVITPAFFDANVKLSYDLKLMHQVKLQVNAGVLNVFGSYQRDFDRGPDRDSGYIYGPMLPRSIFVGVKLGI